MTRTPSPELERMGVRQLDGDALDVDRTIEVCRECHHFDAAICTIGGGPAELSADGSAAINVIDAARSAGIRRFILISSLGAGDSREYASERLLAAIGPVLEEKTRAEQHMMASGMDFTILRPGQLLDGSPTGRGLLCEDPSVHGCIRRADLAALIMDCLDRKETISCILSAISEPQE